MLSILKKNGCNVVKITQNLHQTNELVLETGNYICATGETKELQKEESYPICPKTNQPTTWRHVDHAYKTGDQVTETGFYMDKYGVKIKRKQVDVFPDCQNSGQPTVWKHT
jgi:hypothetical protein